MSLRVRSVSGRRRVPWPPTGSPRARASYDGRPMSLVREPERAQSRRDRAGCARRRRPALRIRSPAVGPVELAELGPLGDDDRRVRAVERLERRLGDLDAVQVRRAVRDRVPGASRRRPRRAAGPARTRLGASRMSSVPGLNASPRSAIRLPRSGPSRRSSFPITRRFWSSFTSMTAFRSWKL